MPLFFAPPNLPERSRDQELQHSHLGLDHLGAHQRLDEPDDVDGLESERRRKVSRVDRGAAIALLREGQEQGALELLDELFGELVLVLSFGRFGHGERDGGRKKGKRKKESGGDRKSPA